MLGGEFGNVGVHAILLVEYVYQLGLCAVELGPPAEPPKQGPAQAMLASLLSWGTGKTQNSRTVSKCGSDR